MESIESIEFKVSVPTLPWEETPVSKAITLKGENQADIEAQANDIAHRMAQDLDRTIRWNRQGSPMGHYLEPATLEVERLDDSTVSLSLIIYSAREVECRAYGRNRREAEDALRKAWYAYCAKWPERRDPGQIDRNWDNLYYDEVISGTCTIH